MDPLLESSGVEVEKRHSHGGYAASPKKKHLGVDSPVLNDGGILDVLWMDKPVEDTTMREWKFNDKLTQFEIPIRSDVTSLYLNLLQTNSYWSAIIMSFPLLSPKNSTSLMY